MWCEWPNRLALAELWARGTLRRRAAQEEAWEELSRLGWGRRTGRARELVLDERHRADVEAVLDRCWPDWEFEVEALRRARLHPDPAGWKELARRRRAAELDAERLPERMSVRTATAAVAEHSKAGLGSGHRETLARVDLVRDGLLRLRPHAGLRVKRGDRTLDAVDAAGLLGELILTERALRDGTVLDGSRPRAVLTVENAGPFADLDLPEGWLAAHVPGWNTRMVHPLLRMLGEVPWLHFGDLDPAGLRIVRHLRSLRADLIWLVPEFARECVTERALPLRWPPGLVRADDPPLVRMLADRGRWLEQEVLVLDPRLRDAMEAVAEGRGESLDADRIG